MSSDTSRLGFYLLLAPIFLWLVVLIILPHVGLFIVSITEKIGPREYTVGLGNYAKFFEEPLFWHTFARTAIMSIVATVLTLLLGFPIAYYIAKLTKGRTKATLFLMCMIPFWVSELVRTFGWMILLRETGVISNGLQALGVVSGPVELLYNDAAIMVGLVYTSILFMVVPLVTTLDSLDDSLIEAGYDLGGSTQSIMCEVVIPHAMPGIVSGCIVVFMLSLGNYLTPVLLGGKDSLWFTGMIYSQFITRFNWELGSAFGFLLLILSSLVVYLGLRISGQSLSATMGRI
ncbi:ABC transporter permease [Thalassobacter stenotrophicus]|uniref:ABC transporter permease n=1 Tax=Thalassobacter stenotrophicus TaxID=266809 RepID=UPI000D5C7B03|nr:ABC transporter permease [Thalassobacter stenotrophicus]PVZ49399.1 ABC transporter permease [Thalassobacter stenotrophicus]